MRGRMYVIFRTDPGSTASAWAQPRNLFSHSRKDLEEEFLQFPSQTPPRSGNTSERHLGQHKLQRPSVAHAKHTYFLRHGSVCPQRLLAKPIRIAKKLVTMIRSGEVPTKPRLVSTSSKPSPGKPCFSAALPS